ncbi:calcium-binding protein I [Latimeria chalumnae]|uniref:calcium-binding protein I n=1 Tax=Latimeria chalumnae TaxID=7897 RepID=UPI0006D8DCFB|nr:PREDICTED: calcium-binding protein I-like [Latimeria chalumnae]|eukprot:XP_014349842.1 PREDICTED: calcium-binding protein I-like [Latimeria chalumnae]
MGLRPSYPLLHEPVSFEDRSDDDEELLAVTKELHEINLNYCKGFIQQRIWIKQAQKKYEEFDSKPEEKYAEILQKYPDWKEEDITNLRLQFQMFDKNGDRLLEFEAVDMELSEIGDQSSQEERLRYFLKVDTNQTGTIGFEQFLELMHSMKRSTMTNLTCKFQTAGRERATAISKMDTFQQMCFQLF